ncbi:MAG: hypothetical protein COU69_00240 [Candidatus Pacebacteria bacterium CG10_big_fil_rev_8_21_14_0_10_56_10]|nr:MAG: hypothetical protein COU69_00240 [Candidatus Pacebacteria bacterium CG10_big_fil_rev_8_21_14_0_10_56_10]
MNRVASTLYRSASACANRLPRRGIKTLYLTIVGLGLGFGFSVTVFSQPGMTAAQDQGVFDRPHQAVTATSLTLETTVANQPVTSALTPGLVPLWKSKQVVHTVGSAGLGEAGTVVLAVGGLNPAHQPVTKLSLGEQITLTGTNQGRYRFTVVELYRRSFGELNLATTHQRPTLVLYTPSSLIDTNVNVVIGR